MMNLIMIQNFDITVFLVALVIGLFIFSLSNRCYKRLHNSYILLIGSVILWAVIVGVTIFKTLQGGM